MEVKPKVKPKVEPINERELLKQLQFQTDLAINHLSIATDLIQKYNKSKNETHEQTSTIS